MIFVGDTHGIRPIFNIIEYNSIRGSNLIHVGDFGLGFQDIIRDVKNLLTLDEMLLETNNILYVIRGNHDCPIFWDKSKGLNLPKFKNLRLIEDYSVINELYSMLKNPYDEQPHNEKWFAKRPDWARHKVGCSMLSCSS